MIAERGVLLHSFEAFRGLLIEEVDCCDGAGGIVEEEIDPENSAFTFGTVKTLNLETVELRFERIVA